MHRPLYLLGFGYLAICGAVVLRHRTGSLSAPAHGTVTPAGITALQNYFGDAVNVDVTSTSLAGVTRHYNRLEQIIQAVNGARIWAGFHYRSTLVRSNVLGRTVANWVNDNLMQPRGHYDDEGEDNDGHQGQSVNDDNDGSNNNSED